MKQNLFCLFITLFFTNVISVRNGKYYREMLADRSCFNKALLDKGLQDQVHRDVDNKHLFKESCRKFRVEQGMNPIEAARKVIEIYTQEQGPASKMDEY